MSNILLLTGIDEIMTCYLSGYELDEQARKICAALTDNTKRCTVKIVNEWPESYNTAASDVKKAKALAEMQAKEDVVFITSLPQKQKQDDGELLWSSLR
jgi:hypothetical protein